MHQPHVPHMNVAIHILRYLKASPGEGISFSSSNDLHVTTYINSDWANCPITRRSTIGFFIQLGTSPISWCTKKQTIVAHSSAKEEYCTMVVTICEFVWFQKLFIDLGAPHHGPMTLYYDN